MRVAYLVNEYPKASHTFIRREIEALERRGFAVERFSIRGWDAELVDERDIAEKQRTQYLLRDGVVPLLLASLRRLWRQPATFQRALREAFRMSRASTRSLPYHLVYLAQACRLKEFLDKKPFDHLHAHFGTNSAEVALLTRLLGGPPYGFTAHGSNELDDGKYLNLDGKARHAKFVVAISAYMRSQLLRHLAPENWHKVHVVHCGLNGEFFADAQADATPLPNEPTFICVGRFSPEKGHLILLDAFSRVAERNPEARLVIAGDGPLRAKIEDRIRTLGLQPRVRITGWISNEVVRRELLASRVLVQPSLQEGLPVVLMEAMALGRPVISTFISGIPELVVPETGWLVPAGDAEALADVMEMSTQLSSDQLNVMGEAARARARDRHSIDSEVEKLSALIVGST